MYLISYSDLTLSNTEKEILGAYYLRENIGNSLWDHFSEIPTENWRSDRYFTTVPMDWGYGLSVQFDGSH